MASVESVLRSFEFTTLEKPVKDHLRNVYGTMGIALLACALGGYVHLFTSILSAGFLSTFGAFGLAVWLMCLTPTRDNFQQRLGILLGFSFLTGVSMGPHLEYVISLDPSIVPTAFLATSLIFICFSVCALLCDDNRFLALGGILMSGLSWLILLSFIYIFTGIQLVFTAHVYLGLIVMCGLILYDTHSIINKRRMGDDDYIKHTLDLFLDFIGVFRRLLVILSEKSDNRRRRSELTPFNPPPPPPYPHRATTAICSYYLMTFCVVK
jgi:FtsH-binding integral membrane protein